LKVRGCLLFDDGKKNRERRKVKRMKKDERTD